VRATYFTRSFHCGKRADRSSLIGSPETIGITNLGRPDFGEPVPIHPDEVPVFWACGVTPQAVTLESRPELVITHEPAFMFLTDLPRDGERAVKSLSG
jgi:uncharacterized protein YcsI (UPF0317 family)